MKNTTRKIKQFKPPHECSHCSRKAALYVEGETVFDDSISWLIQHGGKPHANSKPIPEMLIEWMTARGVTVEELVEHLQSKMDESIKVALCGPSSV